MSSQTIKRQRKRRRVDQDGDPEFQVAPMVDVLLVLMLFFMAITSTEVLKKDKNLQLAEAKHGKKKEDGKKNEVVVNIGWNGFNNTPDFSMDGQTYPSADAMKGVLTAQHDRNPAAYVLIRADKDVEYSHIADVMAACGGAGIATVTFSVLTGGGNKPAAKSASN